MSNKINDKDVELYLLKNTDFFLTRESIVSVSLILNTRLGKLNLY